MFNLIGLGLNLKSISTEALEVIKKCKQVYLENYTVDFPYTDKELGLFLEKEITLLNREQVESETFIEKAKKQDIAFLVYGDSLSATTHISLILKCKKEKIPYKIFHNSSILTAIGETGLQLYKFGKTASMPNWINNYKPDSFMEIIKNNLKIKAHTLLLVDIGLGIEKAKSQLLEALDKYDIRLDKILLCEQLGINTKIYYSTIKNLPNSVKLPYCFIIPSDLHFTEKEFLEKN